MKTKAIILSSLLFLIINATVYILTQIYSEDKIDIILKNNLNTLQTNYETLLHTQKLISSTAYQSTIKRDRVIEIMAEANTATKEEKKRLRDELHKLLRETYKSLQKMGTLQYHFLLPSNESFYRAHKPDKFGDDLTDIRSDFKYVNKTQKAIRGFVQGRVAHGFRNTFPLFDKNNKHIGAMEVSFSSDNLQWYLNTISKIHTHFLVNKSMFEAKTWERDDLILKYEESLESLDYMIAYSKVHTMADFKKDVKYMPTDLRESLSSQLKTGNAFSTYIYYANRIDALSFLPINDLENRTVAWIVSYTKSPIIEAVLFNKLVIRIISFFMSLLIVYLLLKNTRLKRERAASLKYQMLLELSTNAVSLAFWEYNFKTQTFLVNDLYYKFLGTTAEKEGGYEISIEKYFKEFLTQEGQQVILDNVEEINSKNSDYAYTFEYTMRRRDGVIITVIVNGYATYDKYGKPDKGYGTKYNITAQKRKELELIDKKEKVKTLLQKAKIAEKKIQNYLELIDKNIVSSSTDLDGIIIDVSTAFTELTGYSRDELIGQNHRILKDLESSPVEYEKLWNTIAQNKIWSGEVKNFKKDRSPYWINAKIFPIFDANEVKTGYLAIRQDITDKKRLEQISIIDELTGLYNRRHFNKVMHNEINRAKRENKLISFLMLDIDHFKQYNDTYGHQKGDDVISSISQVIKEFAGRAGDNAFRLGGEEFGVIFTDIDKEKMKKYASTLIDTIENLKIPHENNSASEYVTISAGLVFSNEKNLDSGVLYKAADDLLYKAKENGRNRLEVD